MKLITGLFKAIWHLLLGFSRLIYIGIAMFIAFIFITAVSVGMKDSIPQAPEAKTALIINPVGSLVEDKKPLAPVEAIFGSEEGETLLLSDLIDAIETAAKDDRINSLVLSLEYLFGPSPSQALEIAEALEHFKKSGKRVVAIGDYFDQSHYLLAAYADEIWMHPKGSINLLGYGVYRSYMQRFLENAMVQMHVFRVGENKSFVEPYLRNDMSDAEREVVGRWVGGLWQTYTDAVELNRALDQGAVAGLVAKFPAVLEENNGNPADVFWKAGLVDALLNHQESEDRLAELVGNTNEDGLAESIGLYEYMAVIDHESQFNPSEKDRVIAVVPVEGAFVPGESDVGIAGSDTIVEQLYRAAETDGIAAIVLRVNSGGGSVFAAEVIYDAIMDIKSRGIPVVASFSQMAASAAYYISAPSDQIWAEPNTLTGSIGVFATFPTIEKLYDYVGLNVDGVGSTPLSGAFRIDRPLDPELSRILTSSVQRLYQDFIGLVAEGRGLEVSAVDAIAGGKVWTGRDAKEIGLVDELGGLSAAVAGAAGLAGVTDYDVVRVGTPLTPEQEILEQLGREFGAKAGITMPEMLASWLQPMQQQFSQIMALKDPQHMYMQCYECVGVF